MEQVIKLPDIPERIGVDLHKVIIERKSIRRYRKNFAVSLEDFSKVLWASYGYKGVNGRVVPSAGAIYPCTIYTIIQNVASLPPGLYLYIPEKHSIKYISKIDLERFVEACLHQKFMLDASFHIIIAVNYQKITRYYGERGIFYSWLEAGHIGQNIYLEATALKLGTVAIGAFQENLLKQTLQIPENILYIFPVGVPI